jgi:hypothetical protein
MSTTKIINGIEYTIPPGTEQVWTLPEENIVTQPPNTLSTEELLDQLQCHTLVRDQDPKVVTELIKDLTNIWQQYTSKNIDSDTLAQELAQFRLNRLCSFDGFDQVTVEVFEHVMVNMMGTSVNL